jgi:hypothetical protein
MNRLSFRLFTLAVSIALAGSVMALGDDDAGTLQRISGYRQWKKVNPEPVKVETPVNIIDPASVGG